MFENDVARGLGLHARVLRERCQKLEEISQLALDGKPVPQLPLDLVELHSKIDKLSGLLAHLAPDDDGERVHGPDSPDESKSDTNGQTQGGFQ